MNLESYDFGAVFDYRHFPSFRPDESGLFGTTSAKLELLCR